MTKAFTLIELLIVIAIIGILAGILFISIGQTPLRDARDTKRVADLQNLRTALTLYYTDNNVYPPTDTLDTGLAPTYIPSEPIDPSSSKASGTCATVTPNVPDSVTDFVAGDYGYTYNATPTGCDNTTTMCTGYLLQACLEDTNNPGLDSDANTLNDPVYDIQA